MNGQGSVFCWPLREQDVVELLLKIHMWWRFTSIQYFVGEFTLTFQLGSWAHFWSKPSSCPFLWCALVNVTEQPKGSRTGFLSRKTRSWSCAPGLYSKHYNHCQTKLEVNWGDPHVMWRSTHEHQIFCSIDLCWPMWLVKINIAHARLRLQSWKLSQYSLEGQSWNTALKLYES